ncbi:MarR family winged helix-turn-helix transcriptional regulator [Streptomyces minutiscleroticus]|uniref:MarR family winged helix-turn-helix transcriptional regulator n=1 Tax=Streptomyces minutiscleroticus TaxID=68238 RepID=UPI0033336781
MTETRPESDPGPDAGPSDDDALDPAELKTLTALLDSVNLLQYRLEQRLRATVDLSFVQFQLLIRLFDAGGTQNMTQLADGVVYSRSGLTYQAGQLEKAGLISRGPDPDDDRAIAVALTDAGRTLLRSSVPEHVRLARRLLFDPLTGDDLSRLAEIMSRVHDHMRAQPPRSADSLRGAGPKGRREPRE